MEIRYLKDLEKVVFDEKWFKSAPNTELYYMFRGEKEKNGLRYDITVFNEGSLGQEFIKTKGHKHYQKIGELYIVLQGKAIFLMQKNDNKTVQDVYFVLAKKNDVVIIPPEYGHVTYNASLKRKLKIANWVSKKCTNEYVFFEKMQGACYFLTKNGWIKNIKYKKIPKLRQEMPFKKMPESLDFLKHEKP
ncbi:MAG: glucose-6-phosphate isomerase family protein [Candidatus Pacebacteria bacterium]|nr:glucose-6-phosphate isomerase family protein [Candidatus Paceibacterota bacterium]